MKKLIGVIFCGILMMGCSTQPEIVDNGQPGEVKVIVFLDENRNGAMDEGEPGLSDQVGLSQDVSCPAGNMDKVTIAETNPAGETVYEELKPGVYCVAYMGNKGSTTKLTVEVPLSSEQEALVAFGLTE